MRESLRKSAADTPHGRTRHDAGSLVLCNGCASPLFILERSIDLGDKAGRSADAFAPLRPGDIALISAAQHLDAGLRATARALAESGRAVEYCDRIERPKAGSLMQCPFCQGAWPQVLTVEKTETLDRAYVLELVTVPLAGKAAPVRGKQIGARKGWVH